MRPQLKGKRGKYSTPKAAVTQRAGKRKYTRHSRPNASKLSASFCKSRGRRLGRKPKSTSSSEIKQVSRSFRYARSYQAVECFNELASPRQRRTYRKIITSTPECNTSASQSGNISNLEFTQDEPVRKKRKYTRRLQQKPSQVIKPGRRGRKRKCAGM